MICSRDMIFGVVTYTNLHFHMVIHYDKLCFGTALHVASLRTKKHVKTSAYAFPLFYATYFHSSDGKAKKEETKWRSKRWNITQHYFFAFLRIFFNDSNFGNQGYSANDERRTRKCHDNLYEGLIVSINEPRLAESSQTSTINGASFLHGNQSWSEIYL